MVAVTKTCPVCDKEFRVTSSHPNVKFCSRKCTYQAQKKPETRHCEQCGRPFECIPSKKRRFCSPKCATAFTQGRNPQYYKRCVCEQCGTSFETYHTNPGRFCSKNCQHQFPQQSKPQIRKVTIIRECIICGTRFETMSSSRNTKFCSQQCGRISAANHIRGANNPNYRGGKVRYRGRNWQMQSRAAAKRDGYKCQICHKQLGKRTNDYGIHHIIPYRFFNGDYEAANQLSNLVTLCRECHGKVERGKLACPKPLL